ncbi:MAG TPA: tetraacyldisaccharide 4'-kinase [Deltaproteobacteria bacterium]|jgi:tetraacyldisaccharide 4'-kinase|nr:tetraacyldisaccharide 4'-kinase [Deltaproteobacteria bacterium]
MRPSWFESREESKALRAMLLPLDLAALAYRAGACLHRSAYDRGWLKRRRLSCRVVSVGNLTVGGSGKTPTAAWLAVALRRRGHKVAIASRGYGRRSQEPVVVVSDGVQVRAGVSAAGDEPLVLAAHAPGVPVLVGPDRSVVGLRAVSAFGADVLVLDDGFHHHRLARNVELLTVDGRFGFGNGRVLPRGPLREPLSALSRADAIGIIDGPLAPADARSVEAFAPGVLQFSARRRPRGLRALSGGPEAPPESLAGLEVGVLAGIARPAALRQAVEALGARVVARRSFPDHHPFRARDVRDLSRYARLWVTTEKDAVKILPSWVGQAEVRVLTIDLEVSEPERILDFIEARMR